MTTIKPSLYLHIRNNILPPCKRIWAYRPSSINFSPNRNTPVSARSRLVTRNFHPSFRISLLCKKFSIFTIKKNITNRCLGLLKRWTNLIEIISNSARQILLFWYSLTYKIPTDYQSAGIGVVLRPGASITRTIWHCILLQILLAHMLIFKGFPIILRCLAAFQTKVILSIPKITLAISTYSQQVD